VIATEFPALEVVASIEGHDDSDVVEDLLPSAFTNYPDISGIYSAAAGNRGLIRHLQQTGRHNDFMIVAHELTDNSRAALRDGIFDAVLPSIKHRNAYASIFICAKTCLRKFPRRKPCHEYNQRPRTISGAVCR